MSCLSVVETSIPLGGPGKTGSLEDGTVMEKTAIVTRVV